MRGIVSNVTKPKPHPPSIHKPLTSFPLPSTRPGPHCHTPSRCSHWQHSTTDQHTRVNSALISPVVVFRTLVLRLLYDTLMPAALRTLHRCRCAHSRTPSEGQAPLHHTIGSVSRSCLTYSPFDRLHSTGNPSTRNSAYHGEVPPVSSPNPPTGSRCSAPVDVISEWHVLVPSSEGHSNGD